jgi:hypothetical protein
MSSENSSLPKSGIDQLVLYRMTSMEEAVRQLTDQVGKLVVIEERQTQTVAAVDRAFAEIRINAASIKALELAQPINSRTNVWVERLMTACVGAVLAAVLMNVGLK